MSKDIDKDKNSLESQIELNYESPKEIFKIGEKVECQLSEGHWEEFWIDRACPFNDYYDLENRWGYFSNVPKEDIRSLKYTKTPLFKKLEDLE